MDSKKEFYFEIMDDNALTAVLGGDDSTSYNFFYKVGKWIGQYPVLKAGFCSPLICNQFLGGKKMKIKMLNEKEMEEVVGGSVFPIFPEWSEFLSSICGFFDGISGSRNNGGC